jgi:putative tryptophan/tyrosine transport system substrate-binding protein
MGPAPPREYSQPFRLTIRARLNDPLTLPSWQAAAAAYALHTQPLDAISSTRAPCGGRKPMLDVRRREFITLLGGAAAWSCVAAAQGAKKRPVIGILGQGTPAQLKGVQLRQYFLGGMRELGYVEGRDFDMVARLAESTSDLPKVAKDLVQLNPDVILATASANALAAKMATSTIPVVVPALGNPVALGLIEAYAHPGGNVTGIMPYVPGLPAKQLELAREIVPSALKIGIVNDPIDAKAMAQWDEIEATAAKLEIKIVRSDVRKPEDIELAFQKFEAEHVEVAIVLQSNLLYLERARIAATAAATSLPAVYGYRVHVETGGLISYGVDLHACLHRAATYVYKILNGARAADLPVELPTKLELAINMKAAEGLGITFPTAILLRADHVIE